MCVLSHPLLVGKRYKKRLIFKTGTSLLFTSRLRLIYWSNSKIANDVTIFPFVIVSLTWFLSHDYLSYKIHSFIYLFSVSPWHRANARNVRLYYPYWQYANFLYSYLYCWKLYLFVTYLSPRKPHYSVQSV